METAKVDIRKLQLLNDRINQTIDALNQVRLSVHGLGLSHTGYGQGQPGFLPGAYPSPFQAYQGPFQAYQNPLVAGAAQQNPYVQGLSHTGVYPQIGLQSPYGIPAGASPWGIQSGASPWGVQSNPYASLGMMQQSPWNSLSSNIGLSHTGADVSSSPWYSSLGQLGQLNPLASDPYLSRITQTFPYALVPFTPAV